MEQSLYLSASVMDYLHLPHCSGWYPLLLSQEQESQEHSIYKLCTCIRRFNFVPLGTLCVIAGLELDNIWYVSDLIICPCICQCPDYFVWWKICLPGIEGLCRYDGKRFVARILGWKAIYGRMNNYLIHYETDALEEIRYPIFVTLVAAV